MTANKYSIIRLVLFVLLIIFWCIFGLSVFVKGMSSVNWLPLALFLAGSGLFILDKKWSDAISFMSFAFVLAYVFVSLFWSYRDFEGESTFFEYAFWQLSIDKMEIFGIALSTVMLLFLLAKFYRRKNLSIYK